MKKLLIALILVMASPLASALQGCKGWGCSGKISSINLDHRGNTNILMNGDMNAVRCRLKDGGGFLLRRDYPGYREKYELLLAAHTANRDVFVSVLGDSSDCAILSVTLIKPTS